VTAFPPAVRSGKSTGFLNDGRWMYDVNGLPSTKTSTCCRASSRVMRTCTGGSPTEVAAATIAIAAVADMPANARILRRIFSPPDFRLPNPESRILNPYPSVTTSCFASSNVTRRPVCTAAIVMQSATEWL